MRKIKYKKFSPNAKAPKRAYLKSSAYDLYAVSDTIINPNEVGRIPIGIGMMIPDDYVGLIFPRSSWFIKKKDASGVIDSDYRGEIFVMINNHGAKPVFVMEGEKVGQMVIVKSERFEFIEVDELEDSERGAGGFGSSGRF